MTPWRATIKANDWEKAARTIAEVVPTAKDLATKSDLADLKRQLEQRFERLEQRFDRSEERFDRLEQRFVGTEARNDTRFDAMEKRFFRWLMVFVAPLWAGVLAALVRLTIFGTF